MRLILIIVILFCLITNILTQWRPQRVPPPQYCVTPENDYGSCVTLSFCPQVVNVFRTTNRRLATQYILALQRSCGTRSINGDPVICCRHAQQQALLSTTTTRYINPFLTTEGPSLPITNRQENPFFSTTTQLSIIDTTTGRLKPTTIATTSNPIISTDKSVDGPTEGEYCRDPKLLEGTCIPLKQCTILTDEFLQKQNDPIFKDYLLASNVQCGQIGTNVCCPSNTSRSSSTRRPAIRNTDDFPRHLPTIEDGCGFTSNSYKKIVGGTVSKKNAWPWIALIGYDDGFSSSPFKCGGTLITSRHVITAAHCIRNDLSFVRLGEYDLTTDRDTIHIDVPVIRKEVHPKYSKINGRSDIAILYLKENVIFTESIAPICLPYTSELRKKSYVKYTPFVVGWGKTMEGGNSANILQELQIPVFDNTICEDRYRKERRAFTPDQFDEAILCAGVLSGGKDTCQGDSGGPLMIPEPYGRSVRYYLIGVVSYGIGCARPNIPGVYSSVQYFMDWIIQKIEDSP